MYSISTALERDRNTLNSSHAWAFLVELTPGTGPVERLTNAREDIVFHALTFTSRPFTLEEVSVSSATEQGTLRATCGDANAFVKTLKENYWRGTTYPHWTVTLWHVDATQPDEVPLSAPITTLRVTKIQLVQTEETAAAIFELKPPFISTTRNIRMERYLAPKYPTARAG